MKTDSSNTDDPKKIFISGSFSQATLDHIVRLEAIGLPSEYAFAASLALRGFESDAPRDFLPPKLKASFEALLNKSLLQRLVIASGMTLIILLLLPVLLEFYLQGRLDDLDATMGESRSQKMEITALERQIENLESQLGGGKSSIRSNSAQLLQELAKRTPEGVWLYHLNLGEKASRRLKLSGYAKSHEAITAYLKELERLEMLRSVSLVRQGAPEQDEPIESVARRLPGLVTFEISGEMR
jgi:Tfp pilus assembly protein PilN